MSEIDDCFDSGWPTYEANLQAYRSNFLSSQSIMLAVGAILLDSSKFVIIALACIALFQIIWVWIPVIHFRALLVDFHKYKMDKRFNVDGEWMQESDNKNPLTELTYCKNKSVRNKVNSRMTQYVNKERPFSNWRETRRKIDIVIPASMILIWILYICHALKLV